MRYAYYVRAMRHRRDQTMLEFAAGSFRDVATLNRLGLHCDGMDYSTGALDLARKRFPELASRLHKMDAFQLPLADETYDLTYHNGFWGLYKDADIDRLAVEQARVSRRTIIATVHNAHNKGFHQFFVDARGADPLFDIRFFHEGEIEALMRRVCKRVTVVPVGKIKNIVPVRRSALPHEDTLVRLGLTHRSILRPYLLACGKRLIDRSERLLCVGEL